MSAVGDHGEAETASRLVGPPEVFRHPIAALETSSSDQTVNWTISNKRYTYTCRQKPSSLGYATVYDLEVFLVALTGLYHQNQAGSLNPRLGGASDVDSVGPSIEGQSWIRMDLSAFLALLGKTPTRQTVVELSNALARLRGTSIEYVKTNNATNRAERIYVGGWVNEAIIEEDPETARRFVMINFSQWTMQALEEDRLFFIDQRLLNIRRPIVRRVAMMLASRSLQADRCYTPESVCALVFPGHDLAKAKFRLKSLAEDGPVWGHSLIYTGTHFVFQAINGQATGVIGNMLAGGASAAESADVPEPPKAKKKVRRLPKSKVDVDPFKAAVLGFMPKQTPRARKPRIPSRSTQGRTD